MVLHKIQIIQVLFYIYIRKINYINITHAYTPSHAPSHTHLHPPTHTKLLEYQLNTYFHEYKLYIMYSKVLQIINTYVSALYSLNASRHTQLFITIHTTCITLCTNIIRVNFIINWIRLILCVYIHS